MCLCFLVCWWECTEAVLGKLLFSFHSRSHEHMYTCSGIDTCAMLRNQLIEADMRKEKAVAANWDKWSWWWSRDKLACFNVTLVKRDMGLQRRNTSHYTWPTRCGWMSQSSIYRKSHSMMCWSNNAHSENNISQFDSWYFVNVTI